MIKTRLLTTLFVLSYLSLFASERPIEWAQKLDVAGVPNLHKVDENLYRSAQPTAEGMTNLVNLGIKTIINLRDNHSDADEIGSLPLTEIRIDFFTAKPKLSYVEQFLKIVQNTNSLPVLVHCQHGADRTGTMCAFYRIILQKWDTEEAIREMKEGNYGYHSIWINLPKFIRKTVTNLK